MALFSAKNSEIRAAVLMTLAEMRGPVTHPVFLAAFCSVN